MNPQAEGANKRPSQTGPRESSPSQALSPAAAAAERQASQSDGAYEVFARFRIKAAEAGQNTLAPLSPRTSLHQQPRAAGDSRSHNRSGPQRRSSSAAVSQDPKRQAQHADSSQLRDPHLLGDTLQGLIRSRGWSAPVAVGSVIARWESLVGEAIAEHCHPESFHDAVVEVRCDSTAWATNLKLMKFQLLEVFRTELGPGVVDDVRIRGPQQPSWKKGRFTVRGKGPRDTYG